MIRNISAGDLKKWIDSKKKVGILDCSDPEVCHIERIKGAVCLPLNRLEEAKSIFNHTQPLVVYCSDYQCNSSLYAAQKLEELGFTQVYEFGGGLAEWKRDIFPQESSPAPMESDITGV